MRSTGLRRCIAAVAVAGMCTAAGVAVAQGDEWDKTTTLSDSGDFVSGFDVTVDDNGTTTAIWAVDYSTRDDLQSIQVRTRPADGEWTASETLAEKPFESGKDVLRDPGVAATTAGSVIAAWVEETDTNDRVVAAQKQAGGSWSEPRQVTSAGNISQLRIAGSASGHAMLVWRQDNGIHASRYTPDNGWSAAKTLSSSGTDPDVAINASGVAYAAWSQSSGSSTPDRIRARYSTPGGAWSSFATLSQADRKAEKPAVAVDKQGSGMVVWRQFLSSSRILESHRPAGKSWTKPVTISNTSRTSYDPDVALDARGSAVAVWQVRISTNDLPRLEVHTASRPSGGAWGTSSRLDPDGLEPKIAMDGQGNATAVWYNVSPEYPYGLSGADKPAGKSWTTPREISSGHLSEEVDLAVGTSGTAAAVVRAYNADEEPTDLPLYAVVRD